MTAVIFTVVAFGFTPRARVVPLIVALPLMILSVMQLLTELFPEIYEKIKADKIRKESEVESGSRFELNDRIKVSGEPENESNYKLSAAASVGFMLILMWLLGFIAGGIIYIIFYYRLFSRESWATSIVTALLVGAISYGLFGYILKANLWAGILF